MSLLDLQSMEPETATDGGGGGGGGDTSSLSLLVCDTHSSNSFLLCL
ncbi:MULTISPECIES: SapB/AmfS family lanthipeptide [unclassified Streptomyces]|uniref:SapB/AmfS family lanthipeptide n=1 Tax=Streptomyces millisiae TaxID=3075542 RepID=A0ABU2LN70_9ACTN|nr:SapB/AmfS family lanthipeptide [Streptomyces sp. DSM 44918]MDT0318998.1 SapB/AmfS family lanthipeptide [Streptomyces sp. DSM 44918]